MGPTRQIFHNYGIHYLTIQPEFSNALGIMLKNQVLQFCSVISHHLNWKVSFLTCKVRYGSVETTSEEFPTTTDSEKCLVVCCEEGTAS